MRPTRPRAHNVGFSRIRVRWAQNALSLSFPILDLFHQGEFLAAGMLFFGAPFEGDPFTIHGAADFIPLVAVYSLE